MGASAGEVLMAVYKNTEDIKTMLGSKSRTSAEAILKAVATYPVPNVTEKQIVIMLNRKYNIEYVAAVTGLSVADVQKKYSSYCDKHN